jgi:DNA-directed RNA polymerase specialized sigma subunit
LGYTERAWRKQVTVAERAGTAENQIHELSKEEGREMFDRAVRRKLGISGEEFMRRWDAGYYDDPDDRTKNPPEVMELGMLMDFAR